MRCDGEPVRPGMRTTRATSRASQPDEQNGTLSADTIRASGLVRPHRKAGHKTAPDQNAKNIESTLAMREPSTQDICGLVLIVATSGRSSFRSGRSLTNERGTGRRANVTGLPACGRRCPSGLSCQFSTQISPRASPQFRCAITLVPQRR